MLRKITDWLWTWAEVIRLLIKHGFCLEAVEKEVGDRIMELKRKDKWLESCFEGIASIGNKKDNK